MLRATKTLNAELACFVRYEVHGTGSQQNRRMAFNTELVWKPHSLDLGTGFQHGSTRQITCKRSEGLVVLWWLHTPHISTPSFREAFAEARVTIWTLWKHHLPHQSSARQDQLQANLLRIEPAAAEPWKNRVR